LLDRMVAALVVDVAVRDDDVSQVRRLEAQRLKSGNDRFFNIAGAASVDQDDPL